MGLHWAKKKNEKGQRELGPRVCFLLKVKVFKRGGGLKKKENETKRRT